VSKYKPLAESLKFINFIRACGVEDNANAEIHYRLADKFFGKDKQVLIEAFRGSAKSTMMEWFIIYAAVLGKVPNFGKVDFIAFVGDSAENGCKNFTRNIIGKVSKSDFLTPLLKIKRGTDSEIELVNAEGVELDIKTYGMRTNIRGVRYKSKRPDIVVMDDVTTNEAITSDTIQKTINDNFYKAIVPALHPTRYRLFVIGTPISQKDILYQLANNPSWVVHKFPVCKKFPCKKEEFAGNWLDRFPYEAVEDKHNMYKASGKLKDFAQEYMLELFDESERLVDEEDIRWFDPFTVRKNKHAFTFYITTDFATSTKKSADFSTIGVWAINSNSDWMLVDGQCKRQTMQENMDDLFKYVQMWKPMSVGIETTGQQGGFISILEEMMMKYKTWFAFAKKRGSKEPGIRPTSDKVQRFVTGVEPKFKQGKIWLPKPELVEKSNHKLWELMEELMEELGKLTLSGGIKILKHDDCIDLLNQLSEIDIIVPSEELLEEENLTHANKGIWGDMLEEKEDVGANSMVF